ncbi:MAG TPA: hypothetical protein VND22_03260, partial [Actinomycetota bacterium]|nr:hypothetical protein [Actinomycetota bacterium]
YVPEIRDGQVVTHEIYYYPLGYPFMGSLFARIVPKDPFVIPNLISYLAVVACLFQIGLVRFGMIGAFLAVFALVASPFTELTVVPWTSTPGAVATAYWAYIGLARKHLGWVHPVIGAVLLGLTFASRGGGELLLLAPVLLGVFWRFRREPQIVRKWILASFMFVAVVAVDLIATVRIFGTVIQPYFREVTGMVGFDVSSMPLSIWHTLVYPGPGGLGWPSLLMRAPWLALAIVGAVVSLRTASPKRAVDLGLLGGFLVSLVVVGSFNAFNAACLQFHCLHYLKMWFPILSMYAVSSLLSVKFARKFLLERVPPTQLSGEH